MVNANLCLKHYQHTFSVTQLCPWDFPGKNTEVGCHFLLQEIFPNQGLNLHLLCLLHWQMDSLPPCHLSWIPGGGIPWRREWTSTPVFLPGEFHGQRSLAGYSPWGCKESDRTERLTLLLLPGKPQSLPDKIFKFSLAEMENNQSKYYITFISKLLQHYLCCH